MKVFNMISKTVGLRLLFAMLFFVMIVQGCKKTSFTNGDAPLLDTTNAALPPQVDIPDEPEPPVDPPVDPEETKPSKYWILDGTANYMTVAHHDDFDVKLGESRTITFWIQTSTTSSSPRFIAKRTSPGYEITSNATGKLAVNARSLPPYSSNDGTTWSTIDIRDNQWHHIAVVIDQAGPVKSWNLYIDGVLDRTSITSFSDPHDFTNPADLVVGARSDNFNSKYAGNIDDIRMYKKAMTFNEIQADMLNTNLQADESELIAAWDFESITDNNVADVKGAHVGVITGTIVLGERQVKK